MARCVCIVHVTAYLRVPGGVIRFAGRHTVIFMYTLTTSHCESQSAAPLSPGLGATAKPVAAQRGVCEIVGFKAYLRGHFTGIIGLLLAMIVFLFVAGGLTQAMPCTRFMVDQT